MPLLSLLCSMTELSTWPTGAPAAFFNTRSERLNCSSSQNTTAVTASATPGQPQPM